MGHVIGKGGSEVSSIETKTGARIKILPARTKDALEREVCVLGSIVSNLKAQELLSARVSEKTQDDARMVRLLRMLVPSGSVRHIVGKQGSNVQRLQHESGAKIQIVTADATEGLRGRVVNITGAPSHCARAQYLISRQIAEDKNFSPYWHSDVPETPLQMRLNPAFAPQVHNLDKSRGGSPHGSLLQQSALKASPLTDNGSFDSSNSASSIMSALIQVPNVAVAYLIGKNGAAISDIERRSGAKIKIRPPKAGESLREASIVGNSDSVSRAKAIIDHKLVQYQSASRQQLQAQQLQFMQQQRSPQFYQQEQNSPEISLAPPVFKNPLGMRAEEPLGADVITAAFGSGFGFSLPSLDNWGPSKCSTFRFNDDASSVSLSSERSSSPSPPLL